MSKKYYFSELKMQDATHLTKALWLLFLLQKQIIIFYNKMKYLNVFIYYYN